MFINLKKILEKNVNIDAWKIVEKNITANELFFIKKELDMNRKVKTTELELHVYKDFEEDGKVYRGSSKASIHPGMSESDVEKIINETLESAKYVKNPYYPLAKNPERAEYNISNFDNKKMKEWLPILTEEIFRDNEHDNGWLNSSELFLNKIEKRIINSEGVNSKYITYTGILEFVITWKGEEEIEIHDMIHFSDYEKDFIANKIKEKFIIAKERANAQKTPKLENIDVLLTGSPIKELFNYYYHKTNTANIYQNLSDYKINDSIQGNKIKGDKLNITLDPFMKNSTSSAPIDNDGFLLQKIDLVKDGVLNKYWGDVRFSYYLDIEPTGNMSNIEIAPGDYSEKELKKNEYLELIQFSDFQIDYITGDFGGEIRLGWYYDGNGNKISVSGGSISGNIKDTQDEMYLSKETQQINNFKGPKTIKLKKVNINGII
ncbi:MAG: metallopeptidase TldD-related protein [Thermotogota bacterium]